MGIQFSPKSLPFRMSFFKSFMTQLIQIALPIALSLFFIFNAVIEYNHFDSRNELQLSQADTVRVSLYSLNRPESLHLSGSEGLIVIYSENQTDTLSKGYFDVNLILEPEKFLYSSDGQTLKIDSLRVSSDTLSTQLITEQYGYRHYSGRLHIKPNENGQGISVVNHVDLESYVASVVGSEMDFDHPEALKAQAVVSRSYALWSIERSPYHDFDLLDHESSQVYFGIIQDKPWYDLAAKTTKGEILTWSNQLILAVFSSTCGGKTANNKDVWGGIDHPYLTIQDDAESCSLSPHYNWSYSIEENKFQELIFQYYGFRFDKKIIEKDMSGRVQKVILTAENADTLQFTGNDFRLFINSYAGKLAIRSTKYDWSRDNDTIIFEGKGLGHGIGLCQWGALGFAQSGWNYKDILTFYFSGTNIVSLNDIESNTLRLYN